MQGLAQLEADHARAEYRGRAGQLIPAKDVVVDDQLVAQPAPRRWHTWRGAGGDHRASKIDRRIVIDDDSSSSDEARMTQNAARKWDRFDAIEDKPDKTIALAFHARHDGTTIDAHRATKRKSELGP